MHKVTVLPTFEPLQLTDVKEWLKISTDLTEDDALIRALIKSARIWAESVTGKALVEQTIAQVWDYLPPGACFELSIPPLISVTTVGYKDDTGIYQTWNSSNYVVDDISTPARVIVKNGVSSPVSTTATTFGNAWKITYKAGSATALGVEENIKTAMLLMIACMYENREDMPLGRESGNLWARSAWNLLSISRTSIL